MKNTPKRRILPLLITGLVFHVAFILSVFDCYFTSPVVQGMKRFGTGESEAKRLVLIVGDGLRADLLYNWHPFPGIKDSPDVVAPYLRSVVETRGAFGVSHTRVPTESRPGHVAIIGGMYEDVSAVTKGWKSNPVNFDSVFNQSSHTFSFGSPDILPMFADGATWGKVDAWTYSDKDEDFTKDATVLDLWVYDQLGNLFKNATSNSHLNQQLRGDKVVFFLHLLGLDTTGHSYRPHSKEYMSNIQVVDSIVQQTEALFSEFYQDEETSFIFTADHGMSEIGNHGDGHPDNTRTPLIAWGRGIRGPLPDSSPSSHDDYSEPWRLNHLLRRDVEQADVASLMAALIGSDWPANSVGILPDVDPSRPGYLLPKNGDESLAKNALVNAKVILEHYRVKHELKKAHALFYKPFRALEGASDALAPRVEALTSVENYIAGKDWFNARNLSAKLIKTGLEGIRYLETYDRRIIRAIVSAAYTGWAAYASLYISGVRQSSDGIPLPRKAAAAIFLGFCVFFAIQGSPWTFYIYVAFPCYFWSEFITHSADGLWAWFTDKNRKTSDYVVNGLSASLVIGALLSMVAAYTHRWIWSAGFFLMGVIWPAFFWPRDVLSRHKTLAISWLASCVVIGIFPALGVDKKENLTMITAGGLSFILVGILGANLAARDVYNAEQRRSWMRTVSTQLMLVLASILVTLSSTASLRAKEGLPVLNQFAGWALLVISSVFPFLRQHPNPLSKIVAAFLAFGPLFVILSISVEGLFYSSFFVTLLLWLEVESALRNGTKVTMNGTKQTINRTEPTGTKLTTNDDLKSRDDGLYQFRRDDMRIALFFLFFTQVGFFGTGNVASIASFYLEPVYRLVPIFNPFLMSALLVFKIVAPYVILSVIFATLNSRLNLPPFSLFTVALAISDGMTMAFFFNVRDTGAWLEIGQSLSFFCITSLLLLWSAGICVAGEYLMKDVLSHETRKNQKKT